MSLHGQYFYHANIRKMISAFGFLFNDISIRRLDRSGNILKTIKVPLTYSPKEKYLAHLEQADKSTTAISKLTPRLAFEYTAINPDNTRKLTTTGKVHHIDTTDKDAMKYGYSPVPFNFDFELNIITKFAEDTTQIIEQILPFFGPDYTLTVEENPDLNIMKDIPVEFTGMSQQDTYEGDFSERRAIVSTLNFLLRGYIWGPTKSAKIIKDARVTVSDSDTLALMETLSVVVNPITADVDDTYGFIETVTLAESFSTLIGGDGSFVVDESGNNIIG